MRKQTIQYDSRVDALVAVSKRLSRYETRYGLESEEFFNRYSGGQMRLILSSGPMTTSII
jgi:hypothetical protein